MLPTMCDDPNQRFRTGASPLLKRDHDPVRAGIGTGDFLRAETTP